jgi:ACS family D-galactonate transporter-like MFS transporter
LKWIGFGYCNYASPTGLEKVSAFLCVLRASAFILISKKNACVSIFLPYPARMPPSPSRPTAVLPQPRTQVRRHVLAMLFITVVINYLDRSNLSVAAPDLGRELGLDSVRKGLLFSAFGWAYAGFQIPGGWLVDRFRPRSLFAAICGLWSLATLCQGLAGTFLCLFGLRLLVGLFEAPSYPLCNRLVTTWFPERERAGAIGFYTAGQYVGLAFLTPVLALTEKQFGWQSVFLLAGAGGLTWAAIWWWRYRSPEESRRINGLEIEYIRAGGGLAGADPGSTPATPEKFRWRDLQLILSRRKLWGIYIGQAAVNSTLWFFLTWFPSYLVDYRHLDFIRAGFLGSLPYLAAFCGILSSGWLSDHLLRRGVSLSTARKAPIVIGLLLCTSIVGANYTQHPALIILFLTLAGFGNGFSSIAWVLVSSLAPKRLLGMTGGVFNFFGNLSSILVPLVIGFLVSGHNFAPALVFVAGLALMGALSYIFVVGRIERIVE